MNLSKEPTSELWIRDVETIKVFADPLRLEILRLLKEPKPVKQIAPELRMPVQKLYYHVNLLVKHGLLQVVEQNLEGRVIENIYQVTARQFKVINPMLASESMPDKAASTLLLSMLHETTHDFQQAFFERDKKVGTPPRHPFFSKKEFRLTDHQLTEFHARLDGLIKEVTALGERNAQLPEPLYELTVAFFKQPGNGSSPPEPEGQKRPRLYFPPAPEFFPGEGGWRPFAHRGRMKVLLSDQPGYEAS